MSEPVILMVCISVMLIGWMRKVNMYEAFVEGAKTGGKSALTILPNLLAMMMGIRMLDASGLLTGLENILAPALDIMGLPAETAAFMLIRPLSGSGAMAALADLLHAEGADSRAGLIASTLMGSSETIVYTMGLYGAAAGINKFRYALPAALTAWLAACLTAGMFYR